MSRMFVCYQCKKEFPINQTSCDRFGERIPVCKTCHQSIKDRINIIEPRKPGQGGARRGTAGRGADWYVRDWHGKAGMAGRGTAGHGADWHGKAGEE